MDSTLEQQYKNQIEYLKSEIKKLNEKTTNQIKNIKYGLNWINVPEAFETNSKNKIPILEEVKEKNIYNSDGKPIHILIEGDNYHALSCLNYTHQGKIDCIYIDPPYNTGDKNQGAFIYNDSRYLKEYPNGKLIEKNDPLRHSSWLSFMHKRLILAKRLLSKSGIIIISIDDNEQANLKLLCDEIFGNENLLGILPTIMNLKGNQDEFGFAGTHEYTIVYAANKEYAKINNFPLDEDECNSWELDEIGYFKKGATLKRTGEDAPRSHRPLSYYPILVNIDKETVESITHEEYKKIYNKADKIFNDTYIDDLKSKYEKLGYIVILPSSDGVKTSWRWGFETFNKSLDEILICGKLPNISLYKKQRPELNELPSTKPKTLFYKPQYSSGNGTNQLKNILNGKFFSNPKPLQLIFDFLQLCTSKDSIILDFFAGSGTTLHATLELNKYDSGNRQCILIQSPEKTYEFKNNKKVPILGSENAFAEGLLKISDITYKRSKCIMQGYKDSKNRKIEGLGNSLKFYKTAFIGNHYPSNATDGDKIILAQKAGCLISLTENTLLEIESNDFYQIFSNGKKYTGIYFNLDYSELGEFSKKIESLKSPSYIYIFSWSCPEIFENEFDDLTNITIKSIPQPILEIYKAINGEN